VPSRRCVGSWTYENARYTILVGDMVNYILSVHGKISRLSPFSCFLKLWITPYFSRSRSHQHNRPTTPPPWDPLSSLSQPHSVVIVELYLRQDIIRWPIYTSQPSLLKWKNYWSISIAAAAFAESKTLFK
jgi:hypothetical protein